MRAMIGLGLFLSACELLPHVQLQCAVSERCDAAVPSPFVLGKADERSNPFTLPVSSPAGVALTSDGKLIVADTALNLVRIWTTFPTRNYQPVDFVLGTANASLPCCTPAAPGAMDEYVLGPSALSVDGDRLIVSGGNNLGDGNQLHIWQPFPTRHSVASIKLPLYMSAVTARNVRGGSPLVVNNRLYVADRDDSRVMIWNMVPGLPIPDADGLIGQTDFTRGGPNSSGTAPTDLSLYYPVGSPASDGTQLAVADTQNNRVLIWPLLPANNAQKAKWALGQQLFTLGYANQMRTMPDLTTLRSPTAVAMSGARLAVADTGNHRVLLWNKPISAMAAPADLLLGQPGPMSATANLGGVSAASMFTPSGVATDGNRLVVSDTGNHRVLIWNSWPTQSGVPADLILGQPAQDANAQGGIYASDASMSSPVALAHGSAAFYVVDSAAHRVLVYAAPPTSPADRPRAVLGQADFVTSARDPVPSDKKFNNPLGVGAEGDTVAVADTGYHRVLIWNSVPTQNLQPAQVVLGHATAQTVAPNEGSPALGLNSPKGVFLGGGKVYVADTGNHRVLIWNSLPTKNQQPPDVVLGQADPNVIMPNRGMMFPQAQTMSAPTAVFADAKSIYVSDSGNHRVLVWRTLTPANGQAADVVLGKPTFIAYSQPTAVTDDSLNAPGGLSTCKNRLYVADSQDHRIVSFDLDQLAVGATALGVYGQPDLSSGGPNAGGLAVDRFYAPAGVLALPNGIYIADTNNGRVVALPPPL